MLAVVQLVCGDVAEGGHLDRRDVHRIIVNNEHAVSLSRIPQATMFEFLGDLGLCPLVRGVRT